MLEIGYFNPKQLFSRVRDSSICKLVKFSLDAPGEIDLIADIIQWNQQINPVSVPAKCPKGTFISRRVTLLVYDLSQGMARAMSMGLVGKQINGIWHTAVVAYDIEYCFGQGIEEMQPGHSHYGDPVERIDMGNTEIPREVLIEYMDHMKTIWT